MTRVIILVIFRLAICSNIRFQHLKHAISNVFNVTTFKEGVKLDSILLNNFRDLGILGLVCLGLCEKQLLGKLLRGWDVRHALQEIVLCHIQKQLVTMMFKVAVRNHCRLLLFTKLTNDMIAKALEA